MFRMLKMLILVAAVVALRPAHAEDDGIKWEKWTDDIFDRAKKENRLVLLDLEAVWCHWCHVMAEITYKDPDVVRLIKSKYIAVRVDQDSRPDLSNRYEEYGWPATIIFGSDGKELAKRSAYIVPREMVGMLQAFIDDPTPGPSVTAEQVLKFDASGKLPGELRTQLEAVHVKRYDPKNKGWGFTHKYLEWDSVEYCMLRAYSGDKEAEAMARDTLTSQLALLDPAWGGVYQYSTDGDWVHPHYEKVMEHNTNNLRLFALAYARWNDPAYLNAAKEIYRFFNTFLSSPDGAFYVSQDADLVPGEHSEAYFKLDDAGRRKLGVPRVDTHVYSRENGWAISAVCALYAATGDSAYLDRAVKAAKWIAANRALAGGGFRHDEKDAFGPYLGDTLAMGQAYLNLYAVTGDRAWLPQAEAAAQFIAKTFASGASVPARDEAGLITAIPPPNSALTPPKPQRDENASAARFANLLFHYTGKKEYQNLSERAFRYLTAPELANRIPAATVLLADYEIAHPPAHLVVVGPKADAQAQALFKAAAAYPQSYKRVEWYDRSEGALPNMDVEYPDVTAAFVCAEGRCSLPIKKAEDLRTKADKLTLGAKK